MHLASDPSTINPTAVRPIVVLRHPIDRLLALFNSRHGRCWAIAMASLGSGASSAVANHSNHSSDQYLAPLDRFRLAYRHAASSGLHGLLRPPSASCLLAGQSISTCSAAALAVAATSAPGNAWSADGGAAGGDGPTDIPAGAVEAPSTATSLSATAALAATHRWLLPARHQLRAAHLILADDFDSSVLRISRALGIPAVARGIRQLPLVVGGEGTQYTSLDEMAAGIPSASAGGVDTSVGGADTIAGTMTMSNSEGTCGGGAATSLRRRPRRRRCLGSQRAARTTRQG